MVHYFELRGIMDGTHGSMNQKLSPFGAMDSGVHFSTGCLVIQNTLARHLNAMRWCLATKKLYARKMSPNGSRIIRWSSAVFPKQPQRNQQQQPGLLISTPTKWVWLSFAKVWGSGIAGAFDLVFIPTALRASASIKPTLASAAEVQPPFAIVVIEQLNPNPNLFGWTLYV